MLSLETPAFEIAGLTVFPDHAVPTQFYYAAPPPTLARAARGLMFDLMAYSVELKHSVLSGTTIPDELGAGFLTMGTECALNPAQRARLTRELADRTGTPQERLSLAAIPYHAGSVSVIALDQITVPGGSDAAPTPAAPTRGRVQFVEHILGSGRPALLGSLRSIFSLSLSQEGVAFLQGLFERSAAPIGVVYDLKFYGLRPAVQAVVHANLSRVFDHFGGSVGGQYQWARADVQASLQHLEETGDIRVELTSQATGEEAQKSKELALSLFRDRIVQEMFRPTPPVPTNPTTGMLGGLSGAASGASVNLTLNIRRSYEDKVVTYAFNERSPEERTHAPQGFLQALLTPADLQRHVHLISLENAFFELLEVLVTGPTAEDMTTLGIRQVSVNVQYGDARSGVPTDQLELVFRPDSTGDKTFAVKRRGRRTLAYAYTVAYEFTTLPGTDGDSFRYELPSRSSSARTLLINPRADFGVLTVEVEPGRLPPDLTEVDVHLAYPADDATTELFRAGTHLRLKPEGTGAPSRWQVRTRDTTIEAYAVTYTFAFRDGGHYVTPRMRRRDALLRVDSPFGAVRQLLIKPVPGSEQVTRITVELDYHDPANHYRRGRVVELAAPFTSVTESWPILDANHQSVRYRVTVQENALVTEGDWEETTDGSILVGAQAHRVGRVEVRLVGPPLENAGIDALQVKVTLTPQVGERPGDPQSVLLQGTENAAVINLTLPPGTPLHYRYQTTVFRSDGSVTESPWKDMTSTPLILTTRAL